VVGSSCRLPWQVYAVDEVGGATEMILERPRQRRQVMRDIRSARFTVNQDQQSVPALFSECAKRVALAFETAEATREQALLEASKVRQLRNNTRHVSISYVDV
jgi:hypothetical protein